MRVLLASWAGRSHYFALVPLGWALRIAGHDVRVISQPGFANTVVSSGMTMTPVGDDVDVAALLQANLGSKLTSTTELLGRWDSASAKVETLRRAQRGLGHFLTLAEVMAPDSLAFARRWKPDLVLFEPTTFVGPLVGTTLGIPTVRHPWCVDFSADLPEIETELFAPLLEHFGLSRLNVNGDCTVDPCPPSMQISHITAYQTMRFVPYNGGGIAPVLDQRGDRPRVCVTWGRSLSELGIHHEVDVIDLVTAAAELPIDLVAPMSAEAQAALPPLPHNVTILDPVPMYALLATCDLVVHHGGSGTLMTAMHAGIPQLVVANMPDLMFNGRHLAKTGAGEVRAADSVDVAELITDIERLTTNSSYQAAAQRLRAESVCQPSPDEVVRVLESLAT